MLFKSITMITALMLFACTTTSEQNLDLPISSPAAGEGGELASGADAKPTAAPVDEQAFNKSLALSAHAIINWQQHFKQPPSASQRRILSQKIAAWHDLDTADNLLKKARAELAIGRIPAAEANLRTAVRLQAENIEVLLELSQLYVQKRDHERAFEFVAQLRSVLEKQPRLDPTTRFRYRYVLALAYIGRGDRAKGHDILSDLISIDPSFAPAYTALASSYISLGRWDAADFIARRGLDRGKDDAALFNLLGAVAAHKRNNNVARDYFNKAITLSPSYAPALVNRANLAAQLGEYQAAELDLQAAVEAAPSFAPAHVAMGVVLRKTGRYKTAIDSLNKAIELDAENSLARYNLGVLYAENLKQPNTALRLFHEVLQIKDQAGDIRELAKLHIEDLQQR